VNERFQYLALMGMCLIGTLPLEFRFGARVYRRLRELFLALIGPFVIFNFVNEIAVTRKLWSYSPLYTTGVRLPRNYPIEEVVFFIAIPICAILTFEAACNVYAGAVTGISGKLRSVPSVIGAGHLSGTRSGNDFGDHVGPSGRNVTLQQFLSGLLLSASGLLLLSEAWWHRDRLSPVTDVGKGFVNHLDWDIPEYTVLTIGLLAGVGFLETAVFQTGLFRLRAYWSTMVICLGFMVLVNGWLTKLSASIVIYSEDEFSGLRPIWDIPLEDFGFGIALLTLVLMSWVRVTTGRTPASEIGVDLATTGPGATL
jgi:lycopene cyclase domain-containing protein